MKVLYLIRIIHSEADYGSLGPKISQFIERRLGRGVVKSIETRIYNYWKLVREKVLKEIKDFRGLLIYQDSLPVGEREKILKFFGYTLKNNPKSQNTLLIKELLEKGAILVGTEDMNLLKKQVAIYRAAVEASNFWEQGRILEQNARRIEELIHQRDVFIARRINESLPENGQGILFIGMEHKVVEELNKLKNKIKVIYL